MSGASPVVLNLGCAAHTSEACINIDWSWHLRLHRNPIGRALAPILIGPERARRFRSIRGAVVVHDLSHGIPAEDQSVDAVYCSHFLEHLDRTVVPGFLQAVHRVLRPGGVARFVVPDFERQARRYVAHLDHCVAGDGDRAGHEALISALIEELVRIEARKTAEQRPIRRRVENLVLGDAWRRGSLHRWVYDRITLAGLLEDAGFDDVRVLDNHTSGIPTWEHIALDVGPGGGERIPDSLYLEGRATNPDAGGAPPQRAAAVLDGSSPEPSR